MPASHPSYSIVVLTFNRNALLQRLLRELTLLDRPSEIIVVDNASSVPASEVAESFPKVKVIRAPYNLGAAGRNLGFNEAKGDIVLCLDDDVYGISPDAFAHLDDLFSDESTAAVNFKVLEEGTGHIVNWVHHRTIEGHANTQFDTYEITEGAVAIRRDLLCRLGGYAPEFFISHEGPDLAFRIMNTGARVIYSPAVSVTHGFAAEGRTSWRNYYYDTRNTFWMAARSLPLVYGARITVRQTLAMFVYSIRDGYLKWWFRGVVHGLSGLRTALGQRTVLRPEAMGRVREIDRFRPSLFYILKRRLLAPVMRL